MSKFNSKILLFGEYGIIKGSKGLAIPFSPFCGELILGDKGHVSSLSEFVAYIKRSTILKQELDLKQLENDLNSGLEFNSNIPQGFGLGSSGALCAALFDRYSSKFERGQDLNSDTLKYIQELMSIMESFFHGTSSGLDPLISYVDKPIVIEDDDTISLIKKPDLSNFGNFYLLDTKIQRKTSPLVHQFLKDCSDERYFLGIKKYMNLTNSIIDSLNQNDDKNFIDNYKEISRLQYLYFDNMIPKTLKDIWLTGLESKKYFLKLCGAGGGGYFMLYTAENKTPLDYSLIKL